jgi:hypothetical protein
VARICSVAIAFLVCFAGVFFLLHKPRPSALPPALSKKEGKERRGGGPGGGEGRLDNFMGNDKRPLDADAREQLGRLISLPNEQIKAQLEKWPRYREWNLGDQGKFLQRIQDMKDKRKATAKNKANELGLHLTPQQEPAFENKYFEKQQEIDKKLRQEMQPRKQELEKQMSADLVSEFSKN